MRFSWESLLSQTSYVKSDTACIQNLNLFSPERTQKMSKKQNATKKPWNRLGHSSQKFFSLSHVGECEQ